MAEKSGDQQRVPLTEHDAHVREGEPGGEPNTNARDREMGRSDEPAGDLGGGRHTWTPPSGEQGISNRPDDEDPDSGSTSHGG
jgi:hypothetical protein